MLNVVAKLAMLDYCEGTGCVYLQICFENLPIFFYWFSKFVSFKFLPQKRILMSEKNFGKPLKPFKDDENCFLFHLNSPCRSQDV